MIQRKDETLEQLLQPKLAVYFLQFKLVCVVISAVSVNLIKMTLTP